jgi:hypothetical protein
MELLLLVSDPTFVRKVEQAGEGACDGREVAAEVDASRKRTGARYHRDEKAVKTSLMDA